MLIKCPECELQVSDKAVSCPHCGYPLMKPAPKKRTRRKKLPNGFGRITKINNKNLKKPFRVMVTVGKDMYGHPIGKPLKPESYFATYNEAYEALVNYNKNPYDIETDVTVSQLYERWSEDYFKRVSVPAMRTVKAAWAYCSLLYNEKVKDIRVRHIKYLLENATTIEKNTGNVKPASANTKERIKSLFNLMFDYAVEYEIVQHNYARDFEISGDLIKEAANNVNGHLIFTDEEMNVLWKNASEMPYVDVILIQCYSGWRPQELGLIRLENVDLDNWLFTGGMKTEAGIDRTVPIHSRVRPFVEKRYEEAVKLESEFLFNSVSEFSHKDNIRLTYDKYRHRFTKIIEELKLNPEHRAHDPRKHFVTAAKKAGVDEYVIKIVIGHSVRDITEAAYTTRDIEWIRSEIEKIP